MLALNTGYLGKFWEQVLQKKENRKRRKKKNMPERSVFNLFFELGKERGPRSVKLIYRFSQG